MRERDRIARNEARMLELYPTFRARIKGVILLLEVADIRPRIQAAWRSPADQETAFRTGHSKLRYGFHNVTALDGKAAALAVDMLDDGAPLNPSTRYLLQLTEAAEMQGLCTGIRWGVPAKLVDAINAAITAKAWESPVKVGWDPCHIQPTGITVGDAKRGIRPA